MHSFNPHSSSEYLNYQHIPLSSLDLTSPSNTSFQSKHAHIVLSLSVQTKSTNTFKSISVHHIPSIPRQLSWLCKKAPKGFLNRSKAAAYVMVLEDLPETFLQSSSFTNFPVSKLRYPLDAGRLVPASKPPFRPLHTRTVYPGNLFLFL